jgi:transcriptional regulator with XRE-family HTH domain
MVRVMKAPKKPAIHPLRRWMFDEQLTQTDFADAVGISQGFLSDMIAGRRKPSDETAAKIKKITKGAITAEHFTEAT